MSQLRRGMASRGMFTKEIEEAWAAFA